jgi:hypothetical protein
MGVRGDGKGEVGWEDEAEETYIDFDDDERDIGLNLNKFVTLERRELWV